MMVKQRLQPAGKPFKILYLKILLWFVGRAIQAAVHIDPVIRRESFSLPDDLSFALSVEPDGPRMVMRKSRETGLTYLGRSGRELEVDLDLRIHNIESAMLIFTFKESTAIAAAHDRISMHGNVDEGCTFVRILDEVETLLLPKFIAKRAVKRYTKPQRLGSLRSRLYLRTIFGTRGI